MTEKTDINLAEMSDDEINNMDPSMLIDDPVEVVPVVDPDTAQSASDDNNTGKPADTSDGTDPAETPDELETTGADSTSDDVTTTPDTEDEPGTAQQRSTSSHQDDPTETVTAPDAVDSTQQVDYKSEFTRVMSPFKASKRTVTPQSVEDVRRLMQMGADYARKMTDMKPYQRVLKTLEKNDLLDLEKINFLIDLDKKNPEAIRKFLKDSEIDPMDLDLEDDINYRPNDHTIPEREMALDAVFNDIRDTEAFPRTAKIITEDWDTASKKILLDDPSIIRTIHEHVESGIFDQIAEVMENERTFGRLEGLSDLEAYKKVGDAIHEAGGFKPNPNETSAAGNTDQGSAQSGSESEASRNARKRAASPTKGNAVAGKTKPNIMGMSDDEIESLDFSTL